jgi:hypothetical protein
VVNFKVRIITKKRAASLLKKERERALLSQFEISLKTIIFVTVMTMKLRIGKPKGNAKFC